MLKTLFQQLVDDVSSIVPAHDFKNEEFLQKIIDGSDPSNNIIFAHYNTTGGFVSGKIKLGITLQVLGGARYLDWVSFNHAYKIFKRL